MDRPRTPFRFFCAFHPSMRPAWAKRMTDLLKPNGELITLMYLVILNSDSSHCQCLVVIQQCKLLINDFYVDAGICMTAWQAEGQEAGPPFNTTVLE